MQYDDEKCYRFHERDLAESCFVCRRDGQRLLIVRQIADMMLVHLCSDCLVSHVDEYLLDNTRPWRGLT